MIKVHSLSGGKTSSYMAVHYPADYNIFSLVTIEDKKCSPIDIGLIKKISDKIGKEFIATAEDDMTLIAMFDLEQKIGKDIIWVVGETFDKIIEKNGNWLPSRQRRYCTTEMKMRPIFDWWYKNINQKIKMGIGYRYDEAERANRFSNKFKGITGKRGTQNKWEELEWREGWFPLIDDKIIHPKIIQWASKSDINFPIDSNCIGCFFKNNQQLIKNSELHPQKFNWFETKEIKRTWKENDKYLNIKNYPKQLDFIFGGGSGCDAGICTD